MRYSLRTLLIVLTLASLGLAVFANRAQRQRVAVNSLKTVFAEIQYDCDTGPRQTSHREIRWIDPNWLHSVTWLILDSPAVNDDSLAHLESLPHLQVLMITEGSEVSSEGLKRLSALPRLKHLVLASGRIQDRGLEYVAKLASLEKLDIQNQPQVTDAGILRLAALRNLRCLLIENTAITKQGVRRLRKLLPSCTIDYFDQPSEPE